MIKRFLKNYAQRHRHPANIALHAIGLPVTFVAPIALIVVGDVFYAAIAFIAGYALQFLGHAIEGNDAGEICLIKKWLGMPYIAIAPRHDEPCDRDTPASNTTD